MKGYLMTIFEFIEKLVHLEGYSDVKCAKNLVGLVGDIASVFQDNDFVRQMATANHIEQSILLL